MKNTKNYYAPVVYDRDITFDTRGRYSPGTKVIIKNGATVTFKEGVFFNQNCIIEIKDGSTLKVLKNADESIHATGDMHLCINTVLDARDGILDLQNASCFFEDGCSFMLEKYRAQGGIYTASYDEASGTLTPDFNSEYSGVNFIAPAKQVFTANPVFRGKWLMPVAYPQWFAGPKCEDWSEPINKAISMKQAGEVLLPKGNLKVRNSIIVKQGVILRGIPKSQNASAVVNGINTYSGTMLIPCGDGAVGKKENHFVLGFMILVNVNPKVISAWRNDPKGDINYDSVQKGPENIKVPGEDAPLSIGETSHHALGTELKDFSIDNTNKQTSQIEALRGVFVVGSATFSDMAFRNLYQAISWANVYSDRKQIVKCTVTHDIKYKEGDEPKPDPDFENPPFATTDSSDHRNVKYRPDAYNVPYAFDLGKLGDAIFFSQNSVGAGQRNALRIYESGGGVFDGNILNADVQIEQCKGISFSNNHLEEGAQLRIIESQVAANGNYMHKGKRESIVVASGSPNLGSEVELSNNQFMFVQGFPFSESQGLESPEQISDYDLGIFGVKEENALKVKNYNIVRINNSFRYWTYHGHFSQMDMYGIKVSDIVKTIASDGSTETYNSENSEFNENSYLCSMKSQLMPFGRIQEYSQRVTIIPSQEVIATVNRETVSKNAFLYWYDLPGTYRYRTQIFCSFLRGIAFPMSSPVDVTIPANESISGNSVINKILEVVQIDLTIPDFLGSGFYVKVVRERLSGDKTKVLETASVEIPVCSAKQLFDCGNTIAGFEWFRTEFQIPVENYFYMPENSIMYNDVTSYSLNSGVFMAWTEDEVKSKGWQKGDILFNVSASPTWNVKVINRTR